MASGSDQYKDLKKIQAELARNFENDPGWTLYQDITRAINNYERKFGESKPSSPPTTAKRVIKKRSLRRKPPARKGQAAMAFDIIKQSKRPVTSSELILALEKAGNPVGGEPNRKTTNLSSVLSKDTRFQSVPWPPSSQSRAWWIRGEPIPSPSVDAFTHGDIGAENVASVEFFSNTEDE